SVTHLDLLNLYQINGLRYIIDKFFSSIGITIAYGRTDPFGVQIFVMKDIEVSQIYIIGMKLYYALNLYFQVFEVGDTKVFHFFDGNLEICREYGKGKMQIILHESEESLGKAKNDSTFVRVDTRAFRHFSLMRCEREPEL
ncbi:hypothetical protein PMAYCL1PPCAC_27862, partial [Pristionchus mayeri]